MARSTQNYCRNSKIPLLAVRSVLYVLLIFTSFNVSSTKKATSQTAIRRFPPSYNNGKQIVKPPCDSASTVSTGFSKCTENPRPTLRKYEHLPRVQMQLQTKKFRKSSSKITDNVLFYLENSASFNKELGQADLVLIDNGILTSSGSANQPYQAKSLADQIFEYSNILKTPSRQFTNHSEYNFDHQPDPEFRSHLPGKHYLAHHTIFMVGVTQENAVSIQKFCQKIVLFGFPHRDRFIFLGSLRALLTLFKFNPAAATTDMQGLKFKFGVTFDGHILKDPETFDGGDMEVLLMTTDAEYGEGLPHLGRKEARCLRGQHFKIAAAPIPPYITFSQEGHISGGTHYYMLEYLGQVYNYSMELDTKTVKGTGIYRDGAWNGMTGAAYYRHADISIMMGGTVERYGVIDFIEFQNDVVFFITRTPNVHIKWQAIAYPYSPITWLCFVFSYICVTLTLYLLLWWKKEKKIHFHALFIPYQITLDQGFDIPIPKCVAFLTALWMFFILVISTGYKSDLVSYFSFPEPEIIPRDFEDLNKRSDYKVIFNYHAGTSFQYFDSAKYGTMKSIRQRFQLRPDTADCAISAALEPHSVCITWGLVIRPIISGNLTLPGAFKPMVTFSKPAVTFPIGFAFPKNSILTDTFQMLTHYFRDAGLVQKWNQDVYQNYSTVGKAWMKTQRDGKVFESIDAKWRKSQTKVRPFQLVNVIAIFAIWSILMVIGMMLFSVEVLTQVCSKYTSTHPIPPSIRFLDCQYLKMYYKHQTIEPLKNSCDE